MAGRPRKPTALLELSGAFDKHPERKAERAREPKPEGPLGPPPARFLRTESSTAAYQLEAWNELLTMVPPGVLTSADRWWAERAACLMAKSRYSSLRGSEETQLATYLSRMACNPADRSKVQVSALPGSVPTSHATTTASSRFKDLASQTAAARPN